MASLRLAGEMEESFNKLHKAYEYWDGRIKKRDFLPDTEGKTLRLSSLMMPTRLIQEKE